jgi:ParB family chromosome partitioning protein
MVAVAGHRHELFDSVDAAIATLYKNFSRQKQHRVRSVARVADELDGILTAPEALSLRQLLRIAAALTRNYGGLMRHALEEASDKAPEEQWRLLLPILVESETTEPVEPTPTFGPEPRPRRTLEVRYNLRVRREMTRDGWSLHFTGREATGSLIEMIFDDIERNHIRTEAREPSPHRPWQERQALGRAMFPRKPTE